MSYYAIVKLQDNQREQPMEQYQHYITKNIQSYYKRHLYSPIIFLSFLLLLGIFFPIKQMMLPTVHQEQTPLSSYYENKDTYLQFHIKELYFTGYTKKWLDRTTGYYYYTMLNEECVIVLLSPETCQQGLPIIQNLAFRGQLQYGSSSVNLLLDHLAEDLDWTKEGIGNAISSYIISEPDATNAVTTWFCIFYVGFGFYAICSIILSLLYIAFPVLSPPCQQLRAYGKPGKILAEAEEELATLPQLATEDMFITEHYFIETSRFGVAIVPIQEILWIYKYSTLYKFLWHHFRISYTLCISANKRKYIRCPKNIKSDIDGIIDYLSEANHDILVGFNEENRQKISKMQGDLLFLQKFTSFLNKKIS